ncbi:MAG: hypothetical protein DMG28_20105 [Acidobacteria bacterium]|nr:MAG: hypothetical protein DMG28_20105 [Acidobacteriota bacterium]
MFEARRHHSGIRDTPEEEANVIGFLLSRSQCFPLPLRRSGRRPTRCPGDVEFTAQGSPEDTFRQLQNDWRDAVVKQDAATLERAHAPQLRLVHCAVSRAFKC